MPFKIKEYKARRTAPGVLIVTVPRAFVSQGIEAGEKLHAFLSKSEDLIYAKDKNFSQKGAVYLASYTLQFGARNRYYSVTIPLAFREMYEIKNQTILECFIDDGFIIYKKLNDNNGEGRDEQD